MKKIYVAGAGGMLGDAIYKVFKEEYELKCTDKNVTDDWVERLDFRNFNAYRDDVAKFKPDYLFHIGAYTDLEWCEENKDETMLVNDMCVEIAVSIANELDIPIVYISTAGIFDGEKDEYDELDIPNPLDMYAKGKYGGERYVIDNANRYFILRAGWMMGGGPRKDKKFVQKIMEQLKNGAKELNVVNDKDGTPTYTIDFANTLKAVIEYGYYGLYNCVCGGMTSRLEVCQEILKIMGVKDVKINEVSSDFFKKEYFANRPKCERLVNRRLNILGLNKMRPWKVALREYLREYYMNTIDYGKLGDIYIV